MSKKKPIDKAQARERRDRMLDAAAAAKLSLTDGVREMRTIAGMTQEEFARHRGVSARVIKAIELGQGNPTVATLNRIGEFFGLEVAFVPIGRTAQSPEPAPISKEWSGPVSIESLTVGDAVQYTMEELQKQINLRIGQLSQELGARFRLLNSTEKGNEQEKQTPDSASGNIAARAPSSRRKKKPNSPS